MDEEHVLPVVNFIRHMPTDLSLDYWKPLRKSDHAQERWFTPLHKHALIRYHYLFTRAVIFWNLSHNQTNSQKCSYIFQTFA